jgi:hypothetical protein
LGLFALWALVGSFSFAEGVEVGEVGEWAYYVRMRRMVGDLVLNLGVAIEFVLLFLTI